MVVAFTPNIGLAKPDETELAENWVNFTKLQEDNNLLIVDKTDINTLSYSPTFVAQTTAPSVGAGSIVGEYQECQGFVWGSFVAVFVNPGISVGVGEYGLTLPFQADGTFHVAASALNTGVGSAHCIGEAYFRDNSAVATCMTLALELVTISTTSYVRFVTEAIAAKSSRLFRDNVPVAIADADSIAGSFFYKKA